jgi:hypothetical protein
VTITLPPDEVELQAHLDSGDWKKVGSSTIGKAPTRRLENDHEAQTLGIAT